MPELPDITAYLAALEPRILGQPLERVRLQSVFVLRTADPPIASVEGRTVQALRRIGKRIAIGVDDASTRGQTAALARPSSHDCRPPSLAAAARQALRPPVSPRPRFSRRLARPH